MVLTSANIAELVAAPASHVIASFVLVDPKLTLAALLGTDCLSPLLQLMVFRQHLVVDLLRFSFYSSLLHFLTCHLDVVDNIAGEAVLDTTQRTEVVCLILSLLEEHVVASISRTLHHVLILISELLPLKLLAAVELVIGEQITQVR